MEMASTINGVSVGYSTHTDDTILIYPTMGKGRTKALEDA